MTQSIFSHPASCWDEAFPLGTACQKTTFLTRSMQDERVHPAWQGCGNDFSALCSEKSPRPTGKAGGYDKK